MRKGQEERKLPDEAEWMDARDDLDEQSAEWK